jgi:hypothetical protein
MSENADRFREILDNNPRLKWCIMSKFWSDFDSYLSDHRARSGDYFGSLKHLRYEIRCGKLRKNLPLFHITNREIDLLLELYFLEENGYEPNEDKTLSGRYLDGEI